MVRAVIFDFDGVIANSEPLHFRAFRDVLAGERVGLTEAEYFERYLGFNDLAAFQAVAADRQLAWDEAAIAGLIEQKARVLEALERGESLLFAGARETIERLAVRCPLAIASGALEEEITRVLEREGLRHHFVALVSSDDRTASKPSPEPYQLAVRRLAQATGVAVAAGECVAIEDSPWGLASARGAGLRTVAVAHTYGAAALGEADTVVDRLEAITWELLGKLTFRSPGGRARDSAF
jgi:HAD superfamily hydrolase (TIGR01509 family)